MIKYKGSFKRWVVDELGEIEKLLKLIISKEDKVMTQVAQDFESLRTAIDRATNDLATRIAALQAKITNSMTDEEVAALKSELGAVATNLSSLAQDPQNPVP